MIAFKPALAAAAVLATLGLAGCQTTEERVYYTSAPAPVASTTTVYVQGQPRYRPQPIYVVQPRPVVVGVTPVRRWEHPRRGEEPGGWRTREGQHRITPLPRGEEPHRRTVRPRQEEPYARTQERNR